MIDPFDRPVPKEIDLQEDQTYVLCEGRDEAALVRALAKTEGLTITAALCSERDNMAGELRQFRLNAVRRRPRALGVIIDKEKNGETAESRLRSWLDSAEFSMPASSGAVIESSIDGTRLRLGYFLNPEWADAGAIEQLFIDQIDPDLSPCVESFIACLQASNLWAKKTSLDVLKDKMRLRVYLAAKQAGTNTALNAGLDAKHLKVSTSAFDSIKVFLRRLCG